MLRVFRRRMIPFLVAFLVIQGLVGVLPHQHGAAPADGRALQTPSPNDVVHRCLACSVHAPAVDVAADFGVAAGLVATAAVTVDRESSVTLQLLKASNSRGPPGDV